MSVHASLPARTVEPPRPARAASRARLLFRCMRPHQWVKNLFVLAPLLFGMRLGEPWVVVRGLLAFVVFCLMSSGLYLLNDVLDAAQDRAHPDKRRRPVASGGLPARWALAGGVTLLAAACVLGMFLGSGFAALAVTYLLLTLAYCLVLKRIEIVDVMVIAAGFVLRVAAGAAAAEVEPSHWLIVCAFLLALYLAFAKRRQELLTLAANAADHRRVLGWYSVAYLDRVTSVLAGTTIVCYALYTMSPDTVARFGTEGLIYGTPFVVYGLLRYMALMQDAVNGGDPSRVLVRDRPLLLAALGWAAFNTAVIYRATIWAIWEQMRG